MTMAKMCSSIRNMVIGVGCWVLVACSSTPTNVTKVDQTPDIYPDYVGVTIPVDIAPLNFAMTDDDFVTIDVEVKGTKENEQMTAFRLKVSEMTPPETIKEAAAFIKAHPTALASIYLLNKYFIQTPTADYKQAFELAQVIQEAKPEDKKAANLAKQLEGMKAMNSNGTLPKFTATDIKGKPISSGDLYAKVNVITTWATWNYESQNIQRQLKRLEKEKGVSQLKIVSVCLDANAKECRKLMDRDSITWSNICDGRMWETPMLTKLGLTKVPDNIITNSQGKIIAHSLSAHEMNKKIEELLK